MLAPIPARKICKIDEGSPIFKPDDLPGEPLINPLSVFFNTEYNEQIVSNMNVPP